MRSFWADDEALELAVKLSWVDGSFYFRCAPLRRVLYDRTGAPQHYLTGAGALFSLGNVPVGSVQGGQVLQRGQVMAWFDGSFVWDASGVLAFVKGAAPQGDLTLPQTAPLRAKLTPTVAPMHPLLVRREPPPLTWRWSERTLAEVLSAARFS